MQSIQIYYSLHKYMLKEELPHTGGGQVSLMEPGGNLAAITPMLSSPMPGLSDQDASRL